MTARVQDLMRAAAVCLSLLWGAAASPAAPPVAEMLPEGAVAVVQVMRPAAVLDVLVRLRIPLNSPELADFAKLVPGGGSIADLAGKIAGGGLAWAAYPGDKSVFVVDAGDAATFATVCGVLTAIARQQNGKPGTFFKEYPGLTVLSLDGKQFFALAPDRAFLSSSPDLLKAIFERQPKGVKALAESEGWRRAVAEAGRDAAAVGWLDMAALNRLPGTAKALATSSPIDVLLAGALKESLRSAGWLALGLKVDGPTLSLHAAIDGKPGPAGAFTSPRSGGALPNLQVPRELGGMTFWRDLRGFYAAREALFPERTSGGVLLENFLEIFFTGRDLTDEVFARFQPEIRLVVAAQQWDPKIGTPGEQYPAAALVFRSDKADEFGEVLEEAWQKAIGITNFTAGQQAKPGLIIDRTTHAGVPFTVAYYSAKGEKDRANLPARFNVRPSLARVGPYLILSTTDQIARDVIDAVNREDGRLQPLAGRHSVVEIASGAGVAAALAVNRAESIRGEMMKSGKKQAAAEADFDRNILMLQTIDSARLTFREQSADLEVRLR
jgi:hypothetical protein